MTAFRANTNNLEIDLEQYQDNFYALCLSILKTYTPEQSFNYIYTGKKGRSLTSKDIDNMIHLKQTQDLSYNEIGKMYGVSGSTVFRHIQTQVKRGDGKCQNKIQQQGISPVAV